MSENLIEMSHVSFYHETGTSPRPVFQDINLVIPKGKVTAILGPSGIGKTTLLRLIGGQLKAQQGQVMVANQNIAQLSHSDLFQLRKRMGMLFQAGGLFTDLTVFENVAFPLREHTNLSEQMIRTLVLTKLQMVGLRGAYHLMPNELSGGMARRIALARAIILDPELVMYDEPFTGQDPISMGVLVKLIKMLNDSLKITSIIVSHDVAETLSIADYVYLIADKKIIARGNPQEITEEKSPQVQQFIQGLADGAVPFHYPADSLQEDFLGSHYE